MQRFYVALVVCVFVSGSGRMVSRDEKKDVEAVEPSTFSTAPH